MSTWSRLTALFRLSCLIAAMAVWLVVPGVARADIEAIWSDAFERCRIHMETGEPMPLDGLEYAPEAERLALGRAPMVVEQAGRKITLPGKPAPDVLLHLPGDSLAMALTLTGCKVLQKPGRRITHSDRQALIKRYKADRDVLISAGTHEIVIEQTPRTIQQFAHRSLQRNVFGECTQSRVIWNMNFITGETEALPDTECDLPSRGAEG